MYGTIARISPLPGREDEVRALLDTWNRDRGPHVAGNRGGYLFRPDANPYDKPTLFLIALFEDEASYRANADDPAQHEWFVQLRSVLAADPDWMDGTFEGS